MAENWIKLHRQFRDSAFYGQAIPVALWVECLLRAGWEKKEKFIGRVKVTLDVGEFVMGYKEMGETVGCGTATVKAWLDIFEQEGMVERRRNARGTVCKLKKWSEYQETRTQTERKRNDDGTMTEPNKNTRNTNRTSDVVIGSGESVDAGASTPAHYAENFLKFDPATQKAEYEYFLGQGIPDEVIRQEFTNFVRYWAELTPGGRKRRWQTEKTFEVRRRLVTWFTRTIDRMKQRGGGLKMPDFRTAA